jgi:hypothetical protein
MKAAVLLFSLILLALASVAFAEPPSQPSAAPAPTVAAEAPTAASVDLALQKIFEPEKPARRTAACYDNAYEYCQNFCWELGQTNGCDMFATQQCLCQRFPADCPVCY